MAVSNSSTTAGSLGGLLGLRVFVYYNLHRRCLSVRATQGPLRGRVIAHLRSVSLADVTFKVSAAGRSRVLREQAKNVHAGALGRITGYKMAASKVGGPQKWIGHTPSNEDLADEVAVAYDPYKWSSFVRTVDQSSIEQALSCRIDDKEVWVLEGLE